MTGGNRLDVEVSDRFNLTRTTAHERVVNGFVQLNGVTVTKPSVPVFHHDDIRLASRPTYVGRGGLKLEHALRQFDISLEGALCLDVGASTGGFTHCMLLAGARRVVAVDTGADQLADRLRRDVRVVSLEKTNVNSLKARDFAELFNFAAVDVSFVSVTKVLANAFALLAADARAVCLVKPQFEAGREAIGKKGVVKERGTHLRVLKEIYSFSAENGLPVQGVVSSPVKGGGGNREFLVYYDLTKPRATEAMFKIASEKAVIG